MRKEEEPLEGLADGRVMSKFPAVIRSQSVKGKLTRFQ